MTAEKCLLLVDDEPNIIKSLSRALRRDGYRIHTAGSGAEGLDILAQHDVGVIVSDQRMPGMLGTEFLEQAANISPEAVKIMLSGYTELNSITEAINRGAIYKFLTKPWEDVLIRKEIREAFEYFELRREHNRKAEKLSQSNLELQQRVTDRNHELSLSLRSLEMERTILETLPCAIVGIDNDGMIVNANRAAQELFDAQRKGFVGMDCEQVLPAAICATLSADNSPQQQASLIDSGDRLLMFSVRKEQSTSGERIMLTCMASTKPA